MKMQVDHEQFANIRRQVLEDEIRGIDPGAYWARIYPGVTEIEFVVVPPKPTLDEIIERARASHNGSATPGEPGEH